MPIELTGADEGGAHAILGRPVIACDYCGRRIEDAALAHVAWGPASPALSYVHKECLEAFIGREWDSREGDWRVGELDTFLYSLLENIGYDHARTAARGSLAIPWGNPGA